jgi:hypothetical protein
MTVSYATYCILDSDREVPEGISGLHAHAVSNLPYRGIGAAVSLLTGPIGDVIAGAVEHEAVVERLMQTHTVLPMRFPTVFASHEAVLAMLSRRHEGFRADLPRLHHRVEFGVRVLWSAANYPSEKRGHSTSSSPDCRVEPPMRVAEKVECPLFPPVAGESSGTQYLRDRYRQYQRRQNLAEQAAQFGRRLDAALSELATAKRLRKAATEAFAFDGVYLVNKDQGAAFRLAFAEARRSEPGFEYLLSGPWPPYNFVTG